jgi:aerobic carbon-monoxide dehydrogenase medium subunit
VEGPYATALEPGELLTTVRVPEPAAGAGIAHEKLSLHERPAVTVTCIASVDDREVTSVRLAVGAVGNRPLRLRDSEPELIGANVDALDRPIAAAAESAAEAADPVEDANGSVEYKRQLIRVLVARCGREAIARACAA